LPSKANLPRKAHAAAGKASAADSESTIKRASAAGKAGTVTSAPAPTARLAVRKTYKLYIGGAFPRSESGRSYPVLGADGQLLAHAAQASRKDVRDAVVAARKAVAGWSGATAYNRGQVLYRIAEMLEGRREQFAAEVVAAEGVSSVQASIDVDSAIDRWVWYAGWADKFAQVVGGTNPVAGPYFNFSLPEPTGVVGIVAPQDSSLLGLVSVLAPAIVTGNTAVVVAAQQRPLPAISFSEVLATSDLPGGVINLLTGYPAELAPWLASHRDVNALDLTGVTAADRVPLQQAAADSVKRVLAPSDRPWDADPGIGRLTAFVETKTVWHPIGI
jgi:acyl-CoA reductase-like NAD-dependent aldehyde dehydrogenase